MIGIADIVENGNKRSKTMKHDLLMKLSFIGLLVSVWMLYLSTARQVCGI